MFKFSLRLCIWLALLVGSVLGLGLDREPWVLTSQIVLVDVEKSMKSDLAPDRVRKIRHESGLFPRFPVMIDLRTNTPIYEFKEGQGIPHYFLNDDEILVEQYGVDDWPILHRRFPEWWWGIFYRPLFWIAVVVFFGTVFEFVSMRKRLKTAAS